MAGDWIKWVKGLSRRREIIIVAERLGIDRRHAAGLFMDLAEWADAELNPDISSVVLSLTLSRMSRDILGTEGAAEAFAEVGWLREVGNGIEFVNWQRHNGESAKKRAKEQKKKANQRFSRTSSGRGKCPQPKGTFVPTQRGQNGGPEKRREEYSLPLPPPISDATASPRGGGCRNPDQEKAFEALRRAGVGSKLADGFARQYELTAIADTIVAVGRDGNVKSRAGTIVHRLRNGDIPTKATANGTLSPTETS